MYAIIDLESTGGQYNEEGITEIAIYRFDGQRTVDRFSCLINPERKIQPFVANMTGINNAMLRHAPKFYEVAQRIIEITKDCILVAHNTRFDYRLLRTEFRRAGYEYHRETLCTIELSRKLIPGLPSYSLGKLVKNLGIPLTNRHRAFGDARATLQLFQLLITKDTDKTLIQKALRKPPSQKAGKALTDIVESLPSEMGVYYIINDAGKIIYIGKSKNIKQQINQHFISDHPASKKLRAEVATVTYDLTGNQLFAHLKENAEIKRLKPAYNRGLKKELFPYGLYHHTDSKGFLHLHLRKTISGQAPITPFTSFSQGKRALQTMIKKYSLCHKRTSLDFLKPPNSSSPAKSSRILREDREKAAYYNQRVERLIAHYSFHNKNILLIGPGRKPSEKGALLIEKGVFKGIAYFDLNHQINHPNIIRNLLTPMKDNRDARQIIQAHMHQNTPFKVVAF